MDWTLGGWANSPAAPADAATAASRSAATASDGLKAAATAAAAATAPTNRNPGIPPSRRLLPAGGDSAAHRAPPVPLVSEVGAEALSSSLTANPGGFLVTLALSNNAIGSAGVAHLAHSLHFNFTLKTLLLRYGMQRVEVK